MDDYDEEERYAIKVWSSRCNYEYYDFHEEVQDNIYEEQEFSLTFGIEVLTYETGEKVACIKGVLFDENKMEDLNLDIVEAADYIAEDECTAAYWLSKCKAYKDKSEDWIWSDTFSGYLATFYVYEPFRKQGIAKYLFLNINKILKYSLNINLRCLCTYPQPQKADEWVNIEDEDLKKVMTKAIKKCGFKAVGKENYYVKQYELV